MSEPIVPDGQTVAPLGRKTLGLMVLGALATAMVIAVGFILPAEFQIDPTGFGKLTGLTNLGTPKPEVIEAAAPAASAHNYPTPYRSDVIAIPLARSGERGAELEYKVRMEPGETIVYSWAVNSKPEDQTFYFDFHGETPAKDAAPAKVVEYRQETGVSANGALTAPIEGVHGWYFLNDNEHPVTVNLRLSGFYRLVAPGEYGNEAGIKAPGH